MSFVLLVKTTGENLKLFVLGFLMTLITRVWYVITFNIRVRNMMSWHMQQNSLILSIRVFFSTIVQNLLKLSSNESLFKLIISDQTLIILK